MSAPSRRRARPPSRRQSAALRAPSSGSARVAVAIGTARHPMVARNRVQRVSGCACASCGGQVLRAGRGPSPRLCVACEVGARDLRQLRAYLRSAERLAAALDRSDIADAARDAVAALDAGRVP